MIKIIICQDFCISECEKNFRSSATNSFDEKYRLVPPDFADWLLFAL